MRLPVRLHFTLGYLVVLLLGMSLTAGLTWFTVEQLYLATQSENLLAQAALTAAALQGEQLPQSSPEVYNQASNIQPGIHARLLGEQGAVIVNLPPPAADTLVQAPLAENVLSITAAELLKRPEIQEALEGQAATAVRRVRTAEQRRVLYAAAPVWSLDGSLVGIVYLATPLPVTGLPYGITFQLLGAVCIAVLLAGAAGTYLARRVALPLENLAQAAEAVAAGDLKEQVILNNRIAEFQNLSQAFNRMKASLSQAEQAKNSFIADVTHELRTPLTVIKGTVETLEDGAIDDLEGRDALLASMHRETDRLIRLVGDLLVLARADASALHLDMKTIDLIEIARSRCEFLAALAETRQVTLCVDAEETGISDCQQFVYGDSDRLSQVIDNLLENAIRHAPPDSKVAVSIRRLENETACEVSDCGSGIPAQHIPFLFDRFYRVDSSRARQTGGTGLGLAIVQALVTAQGGRVAARSIEGEGTVITFYMPAIEDCHPDDP